MMARMMRWAERRARDEARQAAVRMAERVRDTIQGASVEAREAQVIVSGRGLVRRWLIDPELRFLARDGQ
jgi:hypothetical protein